MTTKCDHCGDESNSEPRLVCGRVEVDEETGKAITEPCPGTYQPMGYYTLVLFRAVPSFTNEWNALPAGWISQTRGNFPTELAACERAREMLPHGAPFQVRFIAPEID